MIRNLVNNLVNDSTFIYLKSIILQLNLVELVRIIILYKNRWKNSSLSSWETYINSVKAEDLSSNLQYNNFLPLVKLNESNIVNVEITLLSRKYKIAGCINWEENFNDNEEAMALHRFGWILTSIDKFNGINWKLFLDWIEWRCSIKKLPEVVLDSYTISERICNIIYALHLNRPIIKIQKIIYESLFKDIKHLSSNLEYYGYIGTNNHILNNARALILFGIFYKNTKIENLGVIILKTQYKFHFDKTGVLREGSTHYQFIVTKWFYDITSALNINKRCEYKEIKDLTLLMLDKCEKFQINKYNYIPRIGDVSPDFNPSWFKGFTITANYLLTKKYKLLNTKADRKIECLKDIYNIKVENNELDKSWLSENGEWLKLSNNGWVVFIHSDQRIKDTRTTHGHNDNFSLEIAHKGNIIITDLGRKNYKGKLSSIESGISEIYHNSILINNKGLDFRPRPFMNSKWCKKNITRSELTLKRYKSIIAQSKFYNLPFLTNIFRTVDISSNELILESELNTSIKCNVNHYFNLNSDKVDRKNHNIFMWKLEDDSVVEFKILSKTSDIKLSNIQKYPQYGKSKKITKLQVVNQEVSNLKLKVEIKIL